MSESQDLTAEQITRAANSNLAFTFFGLPQERKRLLTIFYAFCRVIDDIADNTTTSPETKYEQLDYWSHYIRTYPNEPPHSTLEREVSELLSIPEVSRDAMLGIIEGCRSDAEPRMYETFDDLMWYTYRVASCVGIVSATLFGASPAAKEYAIALGHALQVTNILRDVGEDWKEDQRIYIPLEDIKTFGYSVEDLKSGVYNDGFLQLMKGESCRAQAFYNEADRLFAELSGADRKALMPAVAMGLIYHEILVKMQKDGFRIYDHKYRLSKWGKIKKLIVAGFISRKKTT